MPRRLIRFGAPGVVLLLLGCTSLGPRHLGSSRLDYNIALHNSERLELLLNLVRLRYGEPPEFVGLSGMSSQFAVESSFGLGGELGETEGQSSSLALPRAGFVYSERPTLTLLPRRGGDFARQLLVPLELDVIDLLVNDGWGLDRVLEITVERMNDLENRVRREIPVTVASASRSSFQEALGLLGDLHRRGAADVVREERQEALSGPLPASSVGVDDLLAGHRDGHRLAYDPVIDSYRLTTTRQHFVLALTPDGARSPEGRRLARLLGLPEDFHHANLDPVASSPGKSTAALRIELRSVLGALTYLSAGVEVPEEHAAAGWAEPATPAADQVSHPAPPLRILASTTRPRDTLAVLYRDTWFFVRDDDLDSIRTLSLLDSLFRLTLITQPGSGTPVLTLPIGG